MKIKYLFISIAITAGCLLSLSCSKKAAPGVQASPPPEAKPQLEKLQVAEDKRRTVEAEYQGMPVGELAKRLETDSNKDIEPFNSLAYREIVKRGAGAGKELAAFIKASNRSSFLALMAVRKANRDEYAKITEKVRIPILIDALANSKYFNTWGLPHLYWEDAAKAIVESGKPALPGLAKLLADKHDAPVWGSEEVAEYKKYNYRVCDYALALILEIMQRKQEIPVKPEGRDRLIASLGAGTTGGPKTGPIVSVGPVVLDKSIGIKPKR
ncbi:MAG TPA: hypothetical protein VGO50_06790 [Pyrinomonadaceae bacterium]|jgi:hypothetical protein|nr:hypothetical protein [Pyrinomonadaceae bacterium]